MSGYINRINFSGKSLLDNINKNVKKLAQLGMYYDDMVLKQSHSVGTTEAKFGRSNYIPQEMKYSLAMADIGQKKFIAYFDQEYKQRREYLRKFAQNTEIEYILETIADEAVNYNKNGFFCEPTLENLENFIKPEKFEEIKNEIGNAFNRIYNGFGFKMGHDGWSYFKQFLVDGFLAFEIIYDDKGENIIRFKELDPLSLRPEIREEKGKKIKIWVQYEDIPELKRELYDTQIIYISYAKANFESRLSYVERLIRSFNLLRIMENSRIIWNIMNSSYRLKMVVPTGTKSMQKAKESVGELLSIYKEDISLNFDSGELTVNGRPTMQFYKNYVVPSKNGEQTEIDTIGGDGPDLSDTDALRYFYEKLMKDSKVPYNRFDRENPNANDPMSASIDRDEIRFSKFIDRLQNIFQEILLKPLLLQISLKYPEFKGDEVIKSNVDLKFHADNLFEEAKMMEIMSARADFISNMMEITVSEPDETGMMNDVPFFSAKFLVDKYMHLTTGDLELNTKMKEKEKEEQEVDAEDDEGADEIVL